TGKLRRMDSAGRKPLFMLTAISGSGEGTDLIALQDLLGRGVYAFGERTPGRRLLAAGDRIAFYQSGIGVIAEATVDSRPERKRSSFIHDPIASPWVFRAKQVLYFAENPVAIDTPLRARLDAFQGRDPKRRWAWLVQTARIVTEHAFRLLTR